MPLEFRWYTRKSPFGDLRVLRTCAWPCEGESVYRRGNGGAETQSLLLRGLFRIPIFRGLLTIVYSLCVVSRDGMYVRPPVPCPSLHVYVNR